MTTLLYHITLRKRPPVIAGKMRMSDKYGCANPYLPRDLSSNRPVGSNRSRKRQRSKWSTASANRAEAAVIANPTFSSALDASPGYSMRLPSGAGTPGPGLLTKAPDAFSSTHFNEQRRDQLSDQYTPPSSHGASTGALPHRNARYTAE